MPEFEFRAVSKKGLAVNGTLHAASRHAAMSSLKEKGMLPLDIKVANAERWSTIRRSDNRDFVFFRKGSRLSRKHVFRMTSELSVMLRSGIPLDRALAIQLELVDDVEAKLLLSSLIESVKSGKSFSQALEPYHESFGEFYLAMIRSGEMGGRLAEVVVQLADYLEKSKTLRDSIITALLYPAILLSVSILSLILMLGFVVPQFESLFNDLGESLPYSTRVVIGAGNLVAEWGWFGFVVSTLSAAAIVRWANGIDGKASIDHYTIKIPLLGDLVKKFQAARFSRSFGALLYSGVPIVKAYQTAFETLTNVIVAKQLSGVPSALKQGIKISAALEKSKVFSSLAINLIRLGEETGRLDSTFEEIAKIYENEVELGVRRCLTLLEPILILLLGGVVAVIIVSILMGILSVNEFVH